MTDDLQHCPACQEEYVAGVAACVECGGALQPGALDRTRPRARSAHAGQLAGDPGAASPDRLLARLAGAQADLAVRALLLEGIDCRVECAGIVKTYAAGAPPAEPFAVTLPVTVYVGESQHDTAQEILASLSSEDVIGDQWSAAELEAEPASAEEGDAGDAPAGDQPASDEPIPDAPVAEGTSLRTVLLIVIAAIVLLFLFGRS